MNQQQRDELRARHAPKEINGRLCCDDCWAVYPCDTVKVLDAWEAER